jgi:hypothetical protein
MARGKRQACSCAPRSGLSTASNESSELESSERLRSPGLINLIPRDLLRDECETFRLRFGVSNSREIAKDRGGSESQLGRKSGGARAQSVPEITAVDVAVDKSSAPRREGEICFVTRSEDANAYLPRCRSPSPATRFPLRAGTVRCVATREQPLR